MCSMKIGILSDSHDNLIKIEKAVKFFNNKKVAFVLHAGDFIAPFTIIKLKALDCEWKGVFGNNDGEKSGLSRVSEGKIKKGPVIIRLDNKKIILVHDINSINPNSVDADCVVFGHTHRPGIIKHKKKLLVNPGECGGWLTDKSTIALLDLNSLAARIFEI